MVSRTNTGSVAVPAHRADIYCFRRSNVYNKTHIRWTTHNPEGLSSQDAIMAQFCDRMGEEYKELPTQPDEIQVGQDGKIDAGDCCKDQKADS